MDIRLDYSGNELGKYYLIQNDGNSKYKTEITNGVASKIDLASKMEEGKSLYAYVVCDGVASEPVSLKLEKKKLSLDFDYSQVPNLRKEAIQKLNEYQPASIGQASRISGVSPADISVLLVYLKMKGRD